MVIFARQTPPLLIAILISAIAEKKLKFDRWRNIGRSPLLLIVLVFLFYVAGLLYTSDLKNGWGNIERKLSLLVLPVFFTLFRPQDPDNFFDRFARFFIWGITLSAFICLGVASWNFGYELYAREHRIILESYPYTNYFFYSYLAIFMHYGYYSMFAVMAIALQAWLFFDRFQQTGTRKKILQSLNLVFLSVFVLMLYAKAGILMMIAVYICAGIYVLVRLRNRIVTFVLLGSMVLSIVALVSFIPHTMDRITDIRQALNDKNIDKTSDESTRIRLLVWACAFQKIEEKWLTGYGTGDVDTVMQTTYFEQGITAAFEKRLNVHNQFLQTWLTLGIAGALLLVFYIGWYSIYMFRKPMVFPAICYLVILLLSFLTESTLQTQNGTIFTTLFGSLLATEHWRRG